MHRFLIFSMLFVAFTNPPHAMAHPGHGNEQLANTPAHYLLDPLHAVWMVGMIAALVLLSRPGRRLVVIRMRSWNHRPQ